MLSFFPHEKQKHKYPYANNYFWVLFPVSVYSSSEIKVTKGIHFILSMSRANALEYKSSFHKTVFLQIQWISLQLQ